MTVDVYHEVVVIDDRAGFYMVPSATITKARERLSGAHLTEALAGLVCLARESFLQNGASRDEPQTCEASLDALVTQIFGVSRARALRIVDNLADADALTKDARRFDGMRRLPMKLTFVDRAFSFAYVAGPAFRALRATNDGAGPPFGPLALYMTLVALAGEQRDQFPQGNRRIARASQPELAKLSGLSVSSIKRALAALKHVQLVTERHQPANALKTKAVYRLIDPGAEALTDEPTYPSADSSQPNQRLAHSPTDARPQLNSSTAPTDTDECSVANSATARGTTNGAFPEPPRAHVEPSQTTDTQNNNVSPAGTESSSQQDGEEAHLLDIDRLIDVFTAWTSEALGERRAAAVYDAAAWRRAAAGLLEQYDLERILAGVERLSRDALLADRATTLPAFAQIADRAIARAAADRGLGRYRESASATPAAGAAGVSWAAAHDLLRRAVSAYGPGGETAGLAFLRDQHPVVADFAVQVGWRALTRAEESMTDVKFAYLSFCKRDTPEAA